MLGGNNTLLVLISLSLLLEEDDDLVDDDLDDLEEDDDDEDVAVASLPAAFDEDEEVMDAVWPGTAENDAVSFFEDEDEAALFFLSFLLSLLSCSTSLLSFDFDDLDFLLLLLVSSSSFFEDFVVLLCLEDDKDLRRVSPFQVCTVAPVDSASSRAFLSAFLDSRLSSFLSKSASKVNSTGSDSATSASDSTLFKLLSGTALVVLALIS